jgi:hypothetical protein
MTKSATDFLEEILNGLTKEGVEHGSKAEYRRGYPTASEDEIQTMFDAGRKAGAMPHNLEHARLILSDNVFAFTPADGSTKRFAAFEHWPVPDKRCYMTIGVFVMAHTMQQFAAGHPDGAAPDMLRHAHALKKRAQRAIAAGLSEMKVPHLPTAKDFDDAARVVQAVHLAHLAANFEHTADLAHQIATARIYLFPEIDAR